MFNKLPSVTEKNIYIPKESILMCYTDGINEQINKEKVEFGVEPLKQAILLHKEDSLNVVINGILNKLESFKSGEEFSDDIALLGIRFK